ncbi:adenosylcobinamide-GDP ribazoletransferase [Gordonia sp. CPCC 206044]|uniref:adenosylcobinamide-GDP ribazoletransferase n=1 Tax=Gordonia sp. CPCC 206044 TaxID=3140793 RepID=UPI003AF35569
MLSPVRAVGVAFSWMTVVPLPHSWTATSSLDRRVGGAVLAAVPVVGIVLGAAAAVLAWGLGYTDLPTMLVGILVVAALALATRGMHLDGLADTADGLGCYGSPQRIAEVMRSGTVGPFGAATLAAVMIVDTIGFSALADRGQWAQIGLAIAVGRVGAVVGARRGLAPAHPNGFGALVVGTQRTSAVVWPVLAVAAAVMIGRSDVTTAVQTALAVAVALLFGWVFTRHCARRMDGISGDVLGAVIELGTAITVVGLVI